MAITVFKPEEQNASQAPTLGMGSGTFGANAQQRKNIAQGGSGRFTNLQQYVQANEANNPNAQLLQKEATARQGELGTRQQEFTRQAEPIKTGFQAIRSGQDFVQSALQDPTQIVKTPSNIQRFAGYRTQGIGDIETPYNQLQTARGTLGTQQQQLASGLETIQRDPNALQNYLQSQRANPSLATRGENVLDRFLTQSTESGQKAIAGLGTTAGAIRSTQAPSIIGDIETLRTQAQGKPLSSADVGNLLTRKITPEEQFVRNINPEYLSGRIGVNPEDAKYIVGQINKSQENQANLQNTINIHNREIDNLNKSINAERSAIAKYDDVIKNSKNGEEIKNAKENKANAQSNIDFDTRELQKRNEAKRPFEFDLNAQQRWLNQYSSRNQDIVNKYNTYLNQLGSTKQDILRDYDPTRLSRIQALQQLAGTNQFNSLLTGGIQ